MQNYINQEAKIWTKINSRGQTLELCGDATRSEQITLWIDGKRTILYGGASDMLAPTTNPEIFALCGTTHAVTKAEAEDITAIVKQFRRRFEQTKASWRQDMAAEMARFPGVEAALAKYGSYDKAQAAEDTGASDLLLRWENR